MKRLILLSVVLAVGFAAAGWRGRFDEQFAAATASWTPAELNPIAWYKGDGDALDAMGNYDGTWVGTEAYADGITGQAFDFDAESTNVHIYNPTLRLPVENGFTVSTWINFPVAYVHGFMAISSQDHHSAKLGWVFMLDTLDEDTRISCYLGGTKFTSATIPSFTLGEWYNVILRYTPGKVEVVVNNLILLSVNVTLQMADVPFRIRARGANTGVGATDMNFKGQIDDVLIFDRALTATEIKKLYDESVLKNGAAW
jgi:arabinan endo-1,5-alpha-L-arabinosidase